MFRNLILAGVAAVGLAFTSTADAHGPAPVTHYRHETFHRGVWQERHFHDSREAAYFRTRMIRRGYEVNTFRHGYLFDVRFRLPCY